MERVRRVLGAWLVLLSSLSLIVLVSASGFSTDTIDNLPYPGKVYIDAWGWEASPSYQRHSPPDEIIDRNNPDCRYPTQRPGHIVSPDYFKIRIIDESYKWGANMVSLDHCNTTKEAGWTEEALKQVYRHAHHRGMLARGLKHEFAFSTFEAAEEAIINFMRTYNDSLKKSWDELCDGINTEQLVAMTPMLFTKCAFPYDPVMYYLSDNKRFSYVLPNYMDSTATNGRGSDDVSWGYYYLHNILRKQYGRQNKDFQLECRDITAANLFGGLGFPDWRLKQVNDIFRPMARNLQHTSASTAWWINEPPDVCSKENRIYCYGIAQDPIKVAIATNLEVTGRDSPRRVRGRFPVKGRYNYPYTTHFIQNNYLRVYVFPDKEGGVLLYDPESLAQYDQSDSLHLTDNLIETVFEEKIISYRKKVTYPEPVGYKAILQSTLDFGLGTSKLEETRTYTVLNDTPYIRIKVESKFEGSPRKAETKIGAKGYDFVEVNGKSYDAKITLPLSERIKLWDSSGQKPELHIFILNKEGLEDITWNPGDGLYLRRKGVERGSFEIAMALPMNPYSDYNRNDMIPLYHSLLNKELTLTLGKSNVVKNPYPIPLVKVVKVKGGGKDPYLVNEYGWWMFRGAQISQMDKRADYLKVYLEPKGRAKIQKYGFINGVVKPGWGCQYILAIKDVKETPDGGRCKVKVMRLTQAIFAPRVEFREEIKAVKLNGKDWYYFDENLVFLPNKCGEYQLEVMTKGEKFPHLTRTYAHISAMEWDRGSFSFQAELPDGITGIPKDYYFYGLVKHKGYYIEGIKGGDLVRMNEGEGTIFRFKPGQVTLKFSQVKKDISFDLINSKKEISSHLSRMQIGDVKKYIKDFKWEIVNLKQVRDRKGALKEYDVLIWNQFYQKELPEIAREESIKKMVREYLREGGGLFLIAHAVPYVCDLGIEKILPDEELYKFTHPYEIGKRFGSFGFRNVPKKNSHPIFSGLRGTDEKRMVEKLSGGSFPLFRKIGWVGVEPKNGKVLARFVTPEAEKKILQRWLPYGNGKACYDSKICRSGMRSVKCSQNSGFSQRFIIDLSQSSPIKISGWSKAKRISGSKDDDYAIYVDFQYRNGSSFSEAIPFNTGTHDWEYGEKIVFPKKSLKSATAYVFVKGDHTGEAWFDDIYIGDVPGETGGIMGGYFHTENYLHQPGFEREDTAILTEWTYGNGKVIGYGNNLRWEFGTLDKWREPLENEKIFVKNVVKYLSKNKRRPKVGLLCW